jgi:hypothetical protein
VKVDSFDHILSFNFRQTQQYTNQLSHIPLGIIEFIGRTMSLHVSAHEKERNIWDPYKMHNSIV